MRNGIFQTNFTSYIFSELKEYHAFTQRNIELHFYILYMRDKHSPQTYETLKEGGP